MTKMQVFIPMMAGSDGVQVEATKREGVDGVSFKGDPVLIQYLAGALSSSIVEAYDRDQG